MGDLAIEPEGANPDPGYLDEYARCVCFQYRDDFSHQMHALSACGLVACIAPTPIASDAELGQLHITSTNIFRTAELALSLLSNILSTGLIGYKAWCASGLLSRVFDSQLTYLHRGKRICVLRLLRHESSIKAALATLAFLIESGVAYCVLWVRILDTRTCAPLIDAHRRLLWRLIRPRTSSHTALVSQYSYKAALSL